VTIHQRTTTTSVTESVEIEQRVKRARSESPDRSVAVTPAELSPLTRPVQELPAQPDEEILAPVEDPIEEPIEEML
jgi:hypothetical protein